MGENKVKSIEELAGLVKELKKNGKKIVHCHGVFDIVHFGHVQHFLDAKRQGDILIVTVTPDCFVKKGPGRPFFNETIRVNHLASIECIDFVALNQWPTAVEILKLLKPDIYAKGKEVLDNKNIDRVDQKNKSNLALEEEIVNSFGGKLYLTDEVTFSSSRIINQITDALSDESKQFLFEFRKNFSIDNLLEIINSLKDLHVLVIGDSILDKYIFCDVLDKSGKEPIIPYKFLDSATYLGGAFATANQISCFTDNVSLLTCIGDNDYNSIEPFLNKSIERNIFIQKNSQTLTKTRFLDNYKKIKVFEFYNTGELISDLNTEEKILKYLRNNMSNFNVIVIPDFGHGLITPKIREALCESNKFLALNCQMNAGNFGYNFITKYKRADFVSLNDRELRLPFQEKNSEIIVPIRKLSDFLSLNKVNVTLGKSGSAYYENGTLFFTPSFTDNPVDTLGAGVAVLSLTSLLAYKNTSPLIIPFLGNSIGALSVKIIGNERPVDLEELKKFVAYIMK